METKTTIAEIIWENLPMKAYRKMLENISREEWKRLCKKEITIIEEKSLLSENDKEILIDFIRPLIKLGCKIDGIAKNDESNNLMSIFIDYYDEKLNVSGGCIYTPYMENNKFKSLKEGKLYTLKELGLDIEKIKENK